MDKARVDDATLIQEIRESGKAIGALAANPEAFKLALTKIRTATLTFSAGRLSWWVCKRSAGSYVTGSAAIAYRQQDLTRTMWRDVPGT